MDKLDIAIAAFEDEESKLSYGERVMNLNAALSWLAFKRLKRVHKEGVKAKQLEDDEYKMVESQAMYKIIYNLYLAQVKQNKLTGKSEDKMNDDFLKAIKDMKGSMGAIERRLDENLNKNVSE